MEEKFNAVVLRAASYKDNDKMLTLFTLENGVVSACLRGVKKANAKLKFAGEPLCFGEFSTVEKSQRRTVTDVNQIDSFYNVRLDPEKFYTASSCCEFISKFMLDGMRSYDLFLLLINTLGALNESLCENPISALLLFYIKALKFSGYELDFSCCGICGNEISDRAYFNFDDSVVKCKNCSNALDTAIKFSTYETLKYVSDLSAKKESFSSLDCLEAPSVAYALKFIDFYITQRAGVTIKSHKFFIE